MRRLVRAVGALFLVPVVILGNSGAAAAAPGPWRNVTVKAENPVTAALDITCHLTIRQSGIQEIPGVELGSNGYCIAGPDITPGLAQAGESGSVYQVSVDGLTAAGAPCNGSIDGTLLQHPANGTTRVAGAIQAGLIHTGPGCSVQRVGIRFKTDNGGLVDELYWQGVDLPALPEEEEPPTGSCVWGTPRIGEPQVVLAGEGSSTYRWQIEVPVTIAGEVPPGRKWTASWWGTLQQGGLSWQGYGGIIDRFAGTVNIRSGTTIQISRTKTAAKPLLGEFMDWGIEFSTPMLKEDGSVWYNGLGGSGSTSADNFANGLAGVNTPVPPVPGQPHYYGAWTDPGACRFWIGPKILDVAGTEGDEPSQIPGEVEEPPPTEDPEPVPDPEPTIDEPVDLGWLAMIWAVLRSILGVISSIVSGIVNGIKAGLQALFIPDTDSWGVAGVRNQLRDKAPFSVALEFKNEAKAVAESFSSSGGCLMPSFGSIDIKCSDVTSRTGALYVVAQAGIIGAAGFLAFNMVARVFREGS